MANETIKTLGLPTRTRRALTEYGIDTVTELLLFTPQEMAQIPGIGKRSLVCIEEALLEYGSPAWRGEHG